MAGASRIEGPDELEALSKILAWGFGFSVASTTKWLTDSRLENTRVARQGSKVVGGLVQIPMGHWFGGRSVPTLGIAGVAVDPALRGQGVALELMRQSLLEARTRGIPLSSLYPATITLYRAVGYELAGSYCRFALRAADCPRRPTTLELRAIREDDAGVIEDTYRKLAREQTGYLDRGSYIWNRVRVPQGETARGYLVHGADGVEGYAYLLQQGNVSTGQSLVLSDLVALTPGALSALLALLCDHRSTVDQVAWHGAPVDANVFGFAEKVFSMQLKSYWMMRIVDVELALAARGYPPIDLELTIGVEDELLPENSGTYRLALRQGVPSVERLNPRASGPQAELGVRALAALYTGFVSPSELARAGLLQADAATRARLSLVFGGPPPALADYF